jgi:hypothetical protein
MLSKIHKYRDSIVLVATVTIVIGGYLWTL